MKMFQEIQEFNECPLHEGQFAKTTCLTCGKMICGLCTQHEQAQHKLGQLKQVNRFLEAIATRDIDDNFSDIEMNMEVSYQSSMSVLTKLKSIIEATYKQLKDQIPKYKAYIEEFLHVTQTSIKLKSQLEAVIKVPKTITYLQRLESKLTFGLQEIQNESFETEYIEAPIFFTDGQSENIIIEQRPVQSNNDDQTVQQCFFKSKKKLTYLQGRIEKQISFGGGKCWYLDFLYPKPSGKALEPQQCCVICKAHPKFVEFRLHVHKKKFGDICGPVTLNERQKSMLQEGFSRREDQSDLGLSNEIYFHELCTYWGDGIILDEMQGEVNIDSLIKCAIDSQRQTCYLCKRLGAYVRCNQPTCPITVHLACFKNLQENNQKLDPFTKFRMRCPKHSTTPYVKPDWCNKDIQGYGQENKKPNTQNKQNKRIKKEEAINKFEDRLRQTVDIENESN